MSKEKKRLSIEDLIKGQDGVGTQGKEIEIPSLGGTLYFRKPTKSEISSFIENTNKLGGSNLEDWIDEYEKIIYACCDELHSKELYETLDIGDPIEVVEKVMDENDIVEVGQEVCRLSALYRNAEEKVEEKVKNS